MKDPSPAKRIKLELPSPVPPNSTGGSPPEEEDDTDDRCSICLQRQTDRTLIPRCSHEFCFECLVIWTDQSRRCPLCTQGIGEYLIHNIRSKYDYTKYFLPPLRSKSPIPLAVGPSSSSQRRPTRRERQWGQRERREQEVQDQLEQSIRKRKWVYRHNLYAKHVASNIYTRYKPFPTPAQFSASPDYISRATSFLRRELQVWPNLDVEFLTTFTVSIMKSLDIRSESAVKLLSEFLDMDRPYVEGQPLPNADHFAHEVYSYLRSPFRDLYVYDKMVQYGEPEDFPTRTRRDNVESTSRSLSPLRHNTSFPSRPDGSCENNLRRSSQQMSRERGRKRGRSSSPDGPNRARESRDPSVDGGTSRRDGSESRTLAAPPESSSASHPQVVKGKGKAVDLSGVANDLGPSPNGGEPERVAVDKGGVSTGTHGFPKVEHTVIVDSKRGNRDRAPKTLSLRQSVRAHLSLQGTEPLKVSLLLDEPENRFAGPGHRHGRPSLLARVSGMEGAPHNQPTSVPAPNSDTSVSLNPSCTPRLAAALPQRTAGTSSRNSPTREGTIVTDNQCRDPIFDATHENDLTAPAGSPDRVPRVDTDDVLERTRIRLAKMKNMVVAGVPPTAPTPPPIPPDPSTPAEPEETIPPSPATASLRNKLLERLEGERKRAIGAASRELGVEPVAGNISEDSLKAELKARNRLRTRLAVSKSNRHVGTLVP